MLKRGYRTWFVFVTSWSFQRQRAENHDRPYISMLGSHKELLPLPLLYTDLQRSFKTYSGIWTEVEVGVLLSWVWLSIFHFLWTGSLNHLYKVLIRNYITTPHNDHSLHFSFGDWFQTDISELIFDCFYQRFNITL